MISTPYQQIPITAAPQLNCRWAWTILVVVDFLALFVDVEKEFVVCGSVVVVVGEDNVCAVVGEMGECVTENEIGLHYDWTKTAFA